MPTPNSLFVQGRCHIGRVRERNEDCIGIGSWSSLGEVSAAHNDQLGLERPVSLVVADGIGGHRGGNVASQMVVRELRALRIDGDWQHEVDEAIRQVEKDMAEAISLEPQLGGMGATVAGVIISGRQLCHYNVGDSRILLLRDGQLSQLSEDDRLWRSPVLTQAIGGHVSPRLRPKDLHAGEIELTPGDTVLLCSDGLTDRVAAGEIEQSLRQLGTEAASPLLDRALEEGGQDNIAIIIARLAA